jgi:Kdo2-lipid IVA lauroyltransferase/acyltransferase
MRFMMRVYTVSAGDFKPVSTRKPAKIDAKPPMPSDAHFWNVKLAPLRYAAGWLIYAFMRAVVWLPFSWQLALGKRAGAWSRFLLTGRRNVVRRNLEACFPELSEAQRRRLVAAHFAALGASFIEMSMGWFGSVTTLRRLVRIKGAENLADGLAKGRGVILYSGHYTTFELFFPVLAPLCPRLCGMYKTQRNPVMNKIMNKGRGRSFDNLFVKDSVRDMLRELAGNAVVWYASDQSYSHKGGALLPFFGVPAMTNTAISRIARISGAVVLPYFCRRLPGDEVYELTMDGPLEDLPTDDPEYDARRLIAALEKHIRSAPEQYWWIHRRFKGRPPPYPDIYGAEYAGAGHVTSE